MTMDESMGTSIPQDLEVLDSTFGLLFDPKYAIGYSLVWSLVEPGIAGFWTKSLQF